MTAPPTEKPGPECAECRVVAPPGARFCPGCGQALGDACRECGGALPSGAGFCPACGERVESGAQDLLEESLQDGELRVTTVLFADVSSFSSFSEDYEAEDVADVIDEIKDAARRIVEKHGGLVNQFVGDEVMALFGAQKVHEDDAKRAVLAARELHEAVEEIGESWIARGGHPLRLHSGIATGQTLLKPGNELGGRFVATSDHVNAAAHLRSLAPEGEIFVEDETYRLVRAFFEADPMGPSPLKNMKRTVVAYRIGKLITRDRFVAHVQSGLTAFTGRSLQLARLHGALGVVRTGRSRLLLLRGEPGAGKTRLLHEFAKTIPSYQALFLRGQCTDQGAAAPYSPFAAILRGILGLGRGGDVAETIRRLRARFRSPTRPANARTSGASKTQGPPRRCRGCGSARPPRRRPRSSGGSPRGCRTAPSRGCAGRTAPPSGCPQRH